MSAENGERSVAEWQAFITPRIASVRTRMEQAGAVNVDLLAVSKGQPANAAHAAHLLGLSDLGENYAQELKAKAQALSATDGLEPQWHFIGQLQSNKVRMVAPWVTLWQSVDRLRVAKEIAKRVPGAAIFVQANLSQHEHKAGCSLDEVEELVAHALALDLDVQGLMGVGENDDVATTAAQFTRLRSLCDSLGLAHCSIGMSADLEIAIESGSTMVRVGSDIFGPRAANAS